ncbi:MAG: hypothetical protein FWG99_03410 [Treponema sp.]|nr:hypothetical protein [Treponema sp.]
MADKDTANYTDILSQVLDARKNWLEKSELATFKEALRSFQSSFSSLYNIFLKKKLINEDPYKQEAKISELEVPETSSFNEAKRMEQISIRLANLDNQLDFLVNFYQLTVDSLNIEQIKKIIGLIRFIDWANLTPDSQSPITKAVAEITSQSKSGVDQITLSIIGESLTRLPKATSAVMGILRELTAYHKENYKLNVRLTVTHDMAAGDANLANIRKKFSAVMPKTPFYHELIEEIIKEDYSGDGQAMKDAILKSLKVAAEKPKQAKAPVNFKNILLDGMQVIGGTNTALSEIGMKLDENAEVFANQKKSFFEKLRLLIRQMTNSEPEEVFYDLEYLDSTKGITVKEQLAYRRFREDMEKKSKILIGFARGSQATAKLASMTEENIIVYLERNIRDVQNFFKTLNALDEFFKSKIPATDRHKIKGIKPELATLKNSIIRANQLKFEYTAQKEEEEQMKRLGISTGEPTG